MSSIFKVFFFLVVPLLTTPKSHLKNPNFGFTDSVKNLPAKAGVTRDVCSVPELGRSPGVGNGNPLQDSCLGNPRVRGAWQATAHGFAELDLT